MYGPGRVAVQLLIDDIARERFEGVMHGSNLHRKWDALYPWRELAVSPCEKSHGLLRVVSEAIGSMLSLSSSHFRMRLSNTLPRALMFCRACFPARCK
jgi:hypothetical protein